MKKTMSSLVFGLIALAVAPAMATPTCYTITQTPPAALASALPTQICLETIAADPNQKTLAVTSPMPALFQNLRVDEMNRNSGGFSFRSTGEIYRNWPSNCGKGELLTLRLNGQTDSNGNGNATALDISVVRASFTETCGGGRPTFEVYTYTR